MGFRYRSRNIASHSLTFRPNFRTLSPDFVNQWAKMLLARRVVMNDMRAQLLLNLVTVDGLIWNEPLLRALGIISEEQFAANHLADYRLSTWSRKVCRQRKPPGIILVRNLV